MTDPALPQAVLTPVPRRSLAWVLPVLALALTLFLVIQAFGEGGRTVESGRQAERRLCDPRRHRQAGRTQTI